MKRRGYLLLRTYLFESTGRCLPAYAFICPLSLPGAPLLQVVKNVCCVSIVNEWIENHKFNVRRCAGLEDDEFGKAKKPQNAGKGTEKKEEEGEK